MTEMLVVASIWAGLMIITFFVLPLAVEFIRKETMREAFERGHAVQCLGKEGYFWECEE